MPDMTPLSPAGRKPARERHAVSIRAAEEKIADKLPQMTDLILELALGTKPEKCPVHHNILRCTFVSEKTHDVCGRESIGHPQNERMLVYAMNRVAGAPTVSGDKQVSLEFVRKLAKHVADVFHEANKSDDAEERARNFAYGLSQMWLLIAGDTDS